MKLKVARIAHRFSQEDVAIEVGVSQQTVAKWELGVTTPSEFTQIRQLEGLLETPAEDLFPDLFNPVDTAN